MPQLLAPTSHVVPRSRWEPLGRRARPSGVLVGRAHWCPWTGLAPARVLGLAAVACGGPHLPRGLYTTPMPSIE